MYIELIKQFRLVWNENNEIILNEDCGVINEETEVVEIKSVTGGCNPQRSFEADTFEEIEAKINQLGLTEIDDSTVIV